MKRLYILNQFSVSYGQSPLEEVHIEKRENKASGGQKKDGESLGDGANPPAENQQQYGPQNKIGNNKLEQLVCGGCCSALGFRV